MLQLLRQTTPSSKKPQDVEAKGQSDVQRVYDKRMQFIQLLFDIKAEDLKYLPGIDSYCDYLEHEAFQPLLGPDFDFIKSPVSHTNSRDVADCWDWSYAVLQVIRSEEPEISMHDILQRLKEQGWSFKRDPGRHQDKSYPYIAIFGVLCWSSLVVRPRLVFTDGEVPNPTCLLPQGLKLTKSSSPHRPSDRYMRPIPTTFRSFRLQHWGDQSDERTQSGSSEMDSLHEASVNIYSLCYFGHVTVQWVDTISEHLRFNPANRRLSLFRFPTFCALLAIHEDNVCSAIRSIVEQLDPLSPESREQCCASLEQEIILSYRLLFGQDKKSRKIARRELCKLKDACPNQNVDTMLFDLCERKYEYGRLWWKTYDKVLQSYPSEIWPITCRTMEGYLQQSGVYSARDDFPRLGKRLMKLQQFSLRQKPSKLTDLWRDRRNPLQWYTFWAVILVGGLANVLAALQLLVAVIELQASV
ncbi:hypothetical protein FQN49_007730 [Arthroderma sp. PD_2]|nr:hypothetical protein FQN49_007730 [Arthroderma sp. PD_2]